MGCKVHGRRGTHHTFLTSKDFKLSLRNFLKGDEGGKCPKLDFELFNDSSQFVHPTPTTIKTEFFSFFLVYGNMSKINLYHTGISLWLTQVSSMMLLWHPPEKTTSGIIKGANDFTHPLGLAPQLGVPLRKE